MCNLAHFYIKSNVYYGILHKKIPAISDGEIFKAITYAFLAFTAAWAAASLAKGTRYGEQDTPFKY